MATAPLWEVVGGKANGGVLVRQGQELKSPELSVRLSTGAIVKQMRLVGERLQFTKIKGTGPETGWVSLRYKTSDLLIRKEPPEVWILALGSRGDVQPYIALALGLEKSGYRVQLFGPKNFKAQADSFGLEFVPLFGDMQQFIEQNHASMGEEFVGADDFKEVSAEASVADASNSSHAASEKHGEKTSEDAPVDEGELADARRELQTLAEAVEFRKPSLVLYMMLSLDLGLWLESKYGIPAMCASVQPIVVGLTGYEKSVYKENQVVKEMLGVAPLKDLGFDLYSEAIRERSMVGMPSALTNEVFKSAMHPDMAQRMAGCTFTGFWNIDEDSQKKSAEMFGDSKLQSELAAFVNGGAKPVYMGWGSCIAKSPEHMVTLAVGALKQTCMRAVICGGWANLSMELLVAATSPHGDPGGLCKYAEENVLFVSQAPHGWLFPRCACIVHHGGVGTIGAGWLSGTPQLIVPVWYDQHILGDVVAGNEQFSTGGKTTRMHDLSVSEFAKALSATSQLDAKKRAMLNMCKAMVKQENGVEAAVKHVNDFMEAVPDTWPQRLASR